MKICKKAEGKRRCPGWGPPLPEVCSSLEGGPRDGEAIGVVTASRVRGASSPRKACPLRVRAVRAAPSIGRLPDSRGRNHIVFSLKSSPRPFIENVS